MNALSSKLVVLIFVFCAVLSACTGNTVNTNSGSTANGGTANSTGTANNTAPANTTRDTAAREAYPPQVADEFLKSCEEAGSESDFCKCVFDKVQEKYSFEEFAVIESKLTAGTPPEEFVEFTGKARAECTR